MAKGRQKVLILGGGFAGVECARQLESKLGGDPGVELAMVSEDNFLLFTPMLPQVASGMIETRHIVLPIRAICHKTKFYEGRIRNIDPHGKRVTLWGTRERRGISIHYDLLVVALGSETDFFGMADVEKNAYTMKTLNDAVMLRNRAIDMLEHAENEEDPVLRRGLLSFVIAGGGFAGIETAGEVMDLLLDARKYYPTIRREELKVVVVEALPTILPGFSPKLVEFAMRRMERQGIEFRLGTAVVGFDGSEVITRVPDETPRDPVDNSRSGAITTKTLVWTAGVTPVNTIKRSVFKTERGKLAVNDHLEVGGFPGVFAIGDCAMCIDPQTKKPHPATAQIARAQGKAAAGNVVAAIRGTEKARFEYRSKGQMAIIGKRTGIGTFLGINVSGFWAWVLWRNIYLSKMARLEKKTRVFLDWTIDLFFDRDISRLKMAKKDGGKEYRDLDEVDDVW